MERSASNNRNVGRVQELLGSYYGLQDNEENDKNAININSIGFQAKEYVRDILQTKGLAELMQTDHQMISEIKQLDSDMQMLVYENYNKFITATDTIRKMKNNVENMEQEMNIISKSMESINTLSNTVNDKLTDRRKKVEKLVGTRKLLKRFEFLLELPQLLHSGIKNHDYVRAAKYYNVANQIFQRYSHIESFKGIKKEADEIMDNLCLILKNKYFDEINTTFDQINGISDALLKLGKDKSDIQNHYIQWQKNYFEARLNKTQQTKQKDLSLAEFMSSLNSDIVTRVISMVKSYQKLFLISNTEMKHPINKQDDKNFREFTSSFFTKYFNICKTKFMQTDHSFKDSNNENYYSVLNQSLKNFVQDVSIMNKSIPENHLTDKATEVIESCIKHHLNNDFLKFRDMFSLEVRKYYDEIDLIFIKKTSKEDKCKATEIPRMSKEFNQRMRNELQFTLEKVKPLVVSGEGLIPEMALHFSRLVHHQFQEVFLWIFESLELCTGRKNKFSENNRNTSLTYNSIEKMYFFLPGSVTTPLMNQYFIGFLAYYCNELKNSGISKSVEDLIASVSNTSNSHVWTNIKYNIIKDLLYTISKKGVDISNESSILKNGNEELLIQNAKNASYHLLYCFAETYAKDLLILLRKDLRPSSWIMRKDSPTEVRPNMDLFIQMILKISSEISDIIGESINIINGTSNHINRDFRRNTIINNTNEIKSIRQNPIVNNINNIKNDIHLDQNMSIKSSIFTNSIDFSKEKILEYIIKIVYKGFMEDIRLIDFSTFGFHQLQLDIQFLRVMMSSFIQDTNDLELILMDILASGANRTQEPTPLEQSVLVGIVSSKKGKMNIS